MSPVIVALVGWTSSAPVLPPTPEEVARTLAVRFGAAVMAADVATVGGCVADRVADGSAVRDGAELVSRLESLWSRLAIPPKFRGQIREFYTKIYRPEIAGAGTYREYRKTASDLDEVERLDRVASGEDVVVRLTFPDVPGEKMVVVRVAGGKAVVVAFLGFPVADGQHPLGRLVPDR